MHSPSTLVAQDASNTTMNTQSIEEMVSKIFATRRITRSDQHVLMTMFSRGNISATDEMLINQIYEALNQGRVRVVE